MQHLIENIKKFAVVVISRDETLIWENGIEPGDKPTLVYPPIEVDHRHKRTGQYRKAHDTLHRFPEYFENISEELKPFSGILLIGHGHGSSSYADLFHNFLRDKHPKLNENVLGKLNLNISAISQNEILKSARLWFEQEYGKLATWHDRPIDRRFRTT